MPKNFEFIPVFKTYRNPIDYYILRKNAAETVGKNLNPNNRFKLVQKIEIFSTNFQPIFYLFGSSDKL